MFVLAWLIVGWSGDTRENVSVFQSGAAVLEAKGDQWERNLRKGAAEATHWGCRRAGPTLGSAPQWSCLSAGCRPRSPYCRLLAEAGAATADCYC